MENKITFDLISPEKSIFSSEVDMVVVPGIEGDFGVLPEHCSLISELRPGEIEIFKDNKKEKTFFIGGGFAEARREGCTVLASFVKDPKNLDKNVVETEIQKLKNKLENASQEKKVDIEKELEIQEKILGFINKK
ncbi:MAG: ATP synthase F1 subunit epsilon [Pseudomonadota bacterium]|nr:ATP synthase F1 subunit epsilon [Pseudomonadota bacterium]